MTMTGRSAAVAPDHVVQLYDADSHLVETVATGAAHALAEGEGVLIVATRAHRDAVARRLRRKGVDLTRARADGHYVALDAARTLSAFMAGDLPDAARFAGVLGEILHELARRRPRVWAFGEMVALLWADGKRAAAERTEALWNELADRHAFALHCAYPMSAFRDGGGTPSLEDICAHHARVIPAETYSRLDPADRELEVVLLQEKAQRLEGEVARRLAAERELSDFVDHALEGLKKVDERGRILWANAAELALLGWEEHEYVGLEMARLHEDAAAIEDLLERVARGEEVVGLPARLRCKDGSWKHVLLHANACRRDGRLLYARVFTRDVTARTLAEEALRESDRRKTAFLATLAHELRNPLAPLCNGLNLLRRSDRDPAADAAVLGMMDRQLGHMVRLIDDLLEVSRVTRGTLALKKERVALEAVIADALESARPAAAAARHELLVRLPDETVTLHGDRMRLAQIFANLLDNAVRYTPRGGTIHLCAQATESSVEVCVRDDGIGMPTEMLSRVFDMFVQIDDARRPVHGGLGIGLSLVRTIVQLHGGAVVARSEGPGRGSELVVTLPLARAVGAAPAAEAAPASERAASQPARVLVVDDNGDAAASLGMLLRELGFDAIAAHDGHAALECVERDRPSIVLMDLGMPGIDGFEVARRLRAGPRGAELVLIALTGWGQDRDRQRSRAAGFDHHVVKPIDLDTLQTVLAFGPTSRT